MKSVSIQGISGAFHEHAALKYFNDNIEIVSCTTFSALISNVFREKTSHGVIAIENTVAGTIHSNLELIRASDIQIVGEIKLRISQNLAGLPGTRIEELTEVRSHYMAINQSRKFLDQHPHIERVHDIDTATSLKNIAETQQKHIGAIGSEHGVKQYGLEIIASGIETHKENYTRFLVVSKHQKETEFNKASVILKLKHKKGALANLLTRLDSRGINLSKIESFPVMGEPWLYEFFIDLEYKSQEDHIIASEIFNEVAISHRVLGTYLAH